ncbi:MAG: hypothetical protein H6970_00320 [Gammaproteobacteria bacterium]|nr:hypothetical protein [Gammaproteobacteria bacterium]MCP5423504.1 hypothetical protein [Gammaproteobacteria bacterium]
MRLAACVALGTAGPSTIATGAEIHLRTQMDALSGAGWNAQDLDISLERPASGSGSLQLAIARFVLPDLPLSLEKLQVNCPDLLWESTQVRCQAGTLQTALGAQAIVGRGEFTYHTDSPDLVFSLTELNLAQGRVTLQGHWQGDAWQLQVQADALTSGGLIQLLPAAWARQFAQDQQAAGHWRLAGEWAGRGAQVERTQLSLTGKDLTLADSSGRYAAQNLNLELQTDWRQEQFTAQLGFSGQLYLEPLFLEAPQGRAPLQLTLRGRRDGGRWRVDALQLTDPGVLQAQGRLSFAWNDTFVLQNLSLELREAVFPAFYERYLQPFVADTVLGDLETHGRLAGNVELTPDGLRRIRIELSDLDLDDRQGRFGGQNLNGEVDWGLDDKPRRSHLDWRSGRLYRLSLGAARLALETQNDHFRIPARTRIPVLDGALVIERLQGQGLGTDDLQWQFDGEVSPISLEPLSSALQWPPLKGQISGVIPAARYAAHRLTVDGALIVRLFKGQITLNDLRLEDPLGQIPRTFANLTIQNLDLLSLTQTFNFGKIEGKLGGQVRDLRLENWQPVYFDAELATPPGDDSRRRISQRAVENISALGGGGVTEALSRGFIGMFESFRYKRLGIRCRLVNAVCEMDGVAPAPRGYYLVEGGGLPRIDVIGYTRRVDWPELLARLKAAAESEGPVVK